ncbi:MAG: M23 family metallopeptidase, partial [Ruminiclostridium sp.]|nr:M23 family metallopeptidase [Ruminiclostridium sp.]
ADTPEDRISGLAQMNGFDPEKLEHESYFSDNLGLTVDTYYGREENVQGSLNTVDIWSLALIDDGNVLYVLSFENIGGLTDVLTGAMRVTDPRTGYWEGDDAIDILKQYAGEDYCFPFDKLEKEKVSYYDGDKWTNSDEIMFNFAVGEEGVPIKAITSGTVIETFSRNVPGYREGIYITIQAADGRKWRYRHLSDFYVTEGDTVRAGDVIAAVGATGWCTGPCLTISFPEDEAEPTALEGGIVGTATNIDE